MEKYTKTTRFCFICNYVSKIIPALQSRCTRFRFGPLASDKILTRLNEIAVLENLKLDPKAAQAIVILSEGDMRKVLNILESCSLAHHSITQQNVYDVTGRPSPDDMNVIYEALMTQRFNEAFNLLLELKLRKSLAVEEIITDLHTSVMNTKLTDEMSIYLVNRMADIEYRLAQGANEKVQIASLTGAFLEVRTFKGSSHK